MNSGEPQKRADILEEVWGMDVSPTPRTIDNFILKFRKLFESTPAYPVHFVSVRNRGYKFEP
ncbi:MAG: winged helix-turn-helix domain-containing protein, partial [Candidatus Aminicenantes bacterium]|nr:winged helix-turn-helix domain-containing protein [Candidatus Aminicenantes bacterium]